MNFDADEWSAWLCDEFEKILAETGEPQYRPLTTFKRSEIRRFIDDLDAGRVSFHTAARLARDGLTHVDCGDLDRAIRCLSSAKDCLIDAYRTAGAREHLGTSAGARGRPPGTGKAKQTAERNRRLAEAYDEQIAAGKPEGRPALIAARDSDPWLREACKGLKFESLRAAMRLGTKNRQR